MKILLSCYACRPNAGSEPGIGWHWAEEVARLGHEVWVLTHGTQKALIEATLADGDPFPNRHFVFYTVPPWRHDDHTSRFGSEKLEAFTYYPLWQLGALRLARRLHREIGFDVVHSVTYSSVRLPSFLGRLGPPFVVGPIGGGERAPMRLRTGFGLRGWLTDLVRDAMNSWVRFDPLMIETYRHASLILVRTPQSQQVIPKRFHPKVRCSFGLGSDVVQTEPPPLDRRRPGEPLRILYTGLFLYWKGVHLAVKAFAAFCKAGGQGSLTLIGRGPFHDRCRRLAQELGVADRIEWIGWTSHSELTAHYRSHHAFLFPSLHDAGGLAVLEALANGLPVVCLDLGGPAVRVDERCGIVVPTGGRGEAEVVAGLAAALRRLHDDEPLRRTLAEEAASRSRTFTWGAAAESLYGPDGLTNALAGDFAG
ncbi:MAG TPA: glycosyltransferase family 4 protein [Azospirillum sp.]|nr:glycosyltransferase family 4 protein [Azospirillum sp.]